MIKKYRKLLLIAAAVVAALIAITQLLSGWGRVATGPLMREAREAMAQSDFQRAGALLDQILTQEPQHQEALLERGKLWAVIGKQGDALQDWHSAGAVEGLGRSKSLASEARYLEGELLVELHRAPAAEQRLLEAWQLSPDQPRPLDLLLRIYVLQMRGSDTRHVLDLLEQHRQLALEEMVLRVAAGTQIIDPPQAIKQLEAFIAGDPQDVHTAVALLHYYLSSDQIAEADRLLSALPATVLAHSDVAGLHALSELKRFSARQARQVLQQSQPTNQPPGYWWWMAAGELAEAEDHDDIAVESFQRAVALKPDSGVAHYRCGMALEACGESAAAQEQLAIAAKMNRLHQHALAVTRMVGMSPAELAKTMLEIATLERDLKHPAETVRWARLALEVEPANATALTLAQSPLGNQQDAGGQAASLTRPAGAAIPEAITAWLADKTPATASAPTSAASGTPATSADSEAASAVRFEDLHETAQLDFQYFNGNSGSKYLIEAMGGGVSILDFDSDGWPDCYFPQGSQIPPDPRDFSHLDQLYRNLGGERFANVTGQSRIVENGYSQGAAAADVNNDGFCDVFVANYGRSRLFVNQGDGTFIDATDAWGLNESEMSSSAALADLDNDGNLDLYVVNYVDGIRTCRDAQGRISTCSPQNFSGVQDRLYRNSGESSFVDVTTESGAVDADGITYGGNRPSSMIGFFLQNISVTMNPVTSYSSYDCPEPVEIADIDNDGRKDVIVAHGGWCALGVYKQKTDGTMLPEEYYAIPYASHYNPHGLVAGDINGDGLNDIVIATPGYGLVVLYHR